MIASLFFIYGRLRRRELLRRVETIALMNHHVRNSLQVLSYTPYAGDAAAEHVREAVERIEWALNELLPGVHTDGKSEPR